MRASFRGCSAISRTSSGTFKLERGPRRRRAPGAVVLLKGADTVIASPTAAPACRQRTAMAPPPAPATCSPDHRRIPGAGRGGVRGRQHRRLDAWRGGARGGAGLIAEDLTEVLPAVFRRLLLTSSELSIRAYACTSKAHAATIKQ